jgi:serine/threonine protein kinase
VLWEPVVQTDLWQRLVPWGPPGKPFAVTRGAVTTIGYHDDDLSIIPNRTFDARECARQSRRTLTTPKGRGFLWHTKCVAYFRSKAHVPENRTGDIRPLLSFVEKAIRGKARPRSAPLCYREWQVEEKLGGDDRYTEYRAKHTLIGQRGGTARLRVYRVDPYQDEAARQAERTRISHAFRAVAHIPGHPNILTVRDFFPTDDDDFLVLVTEDVPGQALRQHIKKPNLVLTFDQKLSNMRDVLAALAHAHTYGVVHRNLAPDAIVVAAGGHARLGAFDYARVGQNRASTIAHEIIDDLDPAFQAPECYRDPSQASIASDLFSAGLVFYSLLTGEPAFESVEQVFDRDAAFPVKPSELKPDLPVGFDDWLQRLCAFAPEQRFPGAAAALQALETLVKPAQKERPSPPEQDARRTHQAPDLLDLPRDYTLAGRFVVQERLGRPGGFAVAYKVFDTFGDVVRVLKLITRDRQSVFERLRREYTALAQLPDHPYVAKVIWADRLPDETPYIVFEFIDGLDVRELLDAQALSLEDAVTMARQAAAGLAHLHAHSIYHQDIKPSNLLWTDQGVRIIDFNVALSERYENGMGGGTRRYIPPDCDPTLELSTAEKIDRDLYALGITFYECVTGRYPFDEPAPPRQKMPKDPRQTPGCEDLSADVVALLLKVIAPARADRFLSAEAFLEALKAVSTLRDVQARPQTTTEYLLPLLTELTTSKPNFNPYVSHLLTLYSQSQRTNAGTRGLDAIGQATYVDTLLDLRLRPAVLQGASRLVIVSGNAGDGKTAFIQQLERQAEREGAEVQRGMNGSRFTLRDRTFVTNYDGSQDEGEKGNEDVLLEFFAAFQGSHAHVWSSDETHVIAINEGRLIDFLSAHEDRFSHLATLVRDGLQGAAPAEGVLVVNLNLRSVVTDPDAGNRSIFERLIRRMTDPRFWQPCGSCDLHERCYVYHNARTFMDPVAGPKVVERLKTLYTLSHLRGRLHITLRDLRSALAFLLVGTRDCEAVHELYRASGPEARRQIVGSFYFNAWMGGPQGSEDRLLRLLREIDIGLVNDPALDRLFGFQQPDARDMGRFTFTDRGAYDDALFKAVFESLPRAYPVNAASTWMQDHRDYVAMLRRRHYFERRDAGWQDMLPYRSAGQFLALVKGEASDLSSETHALLMAINRGEGLTEPARLGQSLALRVRQVEHGTVRSYRLFDGASFTLVRPQAAETVPYVEYLPEALILRYGSPSGQQAEWRITLDVYDMLTKLNEGYRPSLEDLQGLYRSLAAFKNVLASAPYQEVLVTENGYEFYRIRREATGTLALTPVQEGAA